MPQAVLGGLGSAGSAYLAIDKISEAASPAIAAACGEYEKTKATADAVLAQAGVAAGIVPQGTAGRVASIESFGDAACSKPPTGDPLSTAFWLGGLAGQIATLTAAR